jgi:acyl-coenzyme A thioesterase PaaI-like protein
VSDLRLFLETWKLRAWAYWKIRLIAYVRPTVVEWTEERCEIRVPLTRRTRNHLRSMYFGALWTGADAAAAMIGLKASQKTGGRIAVIFKDARAEFLKRPEADVHFTCAQGRQILELLQKADSTGERQNLPVEVVATVPTLSGDEPVARFTLTLSVKRRGA